jgi:uncharacterized membrane protein
VFLNRLFERLASNLWVVPAAFAIGAVVLSLGTVAVDERAGQEGFAWAFPGDTDTARDILSTIAAGMITFTGIVFTITIVALQLGSQQFSPRVLRTFLHDREAKAALGAFIATTVYALMVLRYLGAEGTDVPRLSISVAILFVMISVVLFVHYLDHMANAIRISSIIARVGDETRAAIERMHGAEEVVVGSLPAGPASRLVRARVPGVLTEIHAERLAGVAAQSGCTLVLRHALGDFVPDGAPLIDVYGSCRTDDSGIVRFVDLERERTMEQDAAFGIRQLVDIAEKAISPAVNDPTSCVQAIDRIHDCLRRLATRQLPSLRQVAPGVIAPGMTWEDYVTLAVDEIRIYGEGSLQVVRRLRAMLEDLMTCVDEERRGIIRREIEALDDGLHRGFADAMDRANAQEPDRQGIGT